MFFLLFLMTPFNRFKQCKKEKYFFGWVMPYLMVISGLLGLSSPSLANLSAESVFLKTQSELNTQDKNVQKKAQDIVNSKQQMLQIDTTSPVKEVQQTLKAQTLIGQLAQSGYALMFFFDSSCSHCHHFAPTVKSISQTYGFQVFDFSFDGKGMSEFTTPAYVTQEIYHAYYGNARPFYPVLILQNVHTMAFYVVAEGDMPEALLLQGLNQYAKELLHA